MTRRRHHHKDRSEQQKGLYQRRGDRASIFDKDVTRCLANVDREAWQDAISMAGGNVSDAAADYGIEGIPRERFVSCPGCERNADPTPLVAWGSSPRACHACVQAEEPVGGTDAIKPVPSW